MPVFVLFSPENTFFFQTIYQKKLLRMIFSLATFFFVDGPDPILGWQQPGEALTEKIHPSAVIKTYLKLNSFAPNERLLGCPRNLVNG